MSSTEDEAFGSRIGRDNRCEAAAKTMGIKLGQFINNNWRPRRRTSAISTSVAWSDLTGLDQDHRNAIVRPLSTAERIAASLVPLMNGRDDSKLRERLCPSLPNKRARWAPWMAIIQRDRTYGVLTPRKHAVLTINSPHVRRKMPKDPAQCIGRLLRRVARARQPPRSHQGSIARIAFAPSNQFQAPKSSGEREKLRMPSAKSKCGSWPRRRPEQIGHAGFNPGRCL